MDRLSKIQRSYCMSRIRGFNTSPERQLEVHVKALRVHYRKNVLSLPGRPDFVFPSQKVALFADGDFWHGWRFPAWKRRLPKFWKDKIERNRKRDRKNFAKLRRMGWQVVRIWEHELKSDIERVQEKLSQISTRTNN